HTSFIIRTGWMVGGGPLDHKFVSLIVAQLRAAKQGTAQPIYALSDKYGCPTYTEDLASIIVDLAEQSLYGIKRAHVFHVTNTTALEDGTTTSRYDVAKHIVKTLGWRDTVPVVPVMGSYFQDKYPTPRPTNEQLTYF